MKACFKTLIGIVMTMVFFSFLFCCSANAEEASVIVYPQPEGIDGSEHYAIQVNEVPSFAYITRRCDRVNKDPQTATFTCFSFEGGPVTVAVTVLDEREIENVIVRPIDLAIETKIEGKTVFLTLNDPAYISVEINGDTTHKCFVFADSPETDVPDPGADNVWYFSPGVHDIGHTNIPEGKDTIYIAGGAYVKGQIYSDYSDRGTLRILGRGIISGENNEHKDLSYFIKVVNAQQVTVDGPILIDANSYNLVLLGTNTVTNYPNVIHNLKEISWVSYTDGLHVDGYIDIDNLFIYNHDDAIDAGQRPIGGTIKNCIIWNNDYGSALLLSWTGKNDTGNVTIENIDVIHFDESDIEAANTAVIMANHGESGNISNIYVNDLHVESFDDIVHRLFSIRVNKSVWASTETPYGSISNIHIANVRIDDTLGSNITLGQSVEHMVNDVLLENITVNGTLISSLSEANVLRNEFSKNIRYVNSYIQNGSFEQGAENWDYTQNVHIINLYETTQDTEHAKNGHYIARLMPNGNSTESVSQRLTEIPAGRYKLTAYVKTAGMYLDAYAYVCAGGEEYKYEIAGTNEYMRITVKDILVENSEITIGFTVRGNDGGLLDVDQIVFEKTAQK